MRLSINNRALLILAVPLALSGCDRFGDKFTCSDEDAINTTLQLVKEQMEKAIYSRSKNEDGVPLTTSASISAALNQIKMSIESIRTTKKDPNSTMQFCSGTLKLVYPLSMIKDAEATREMAQLDNVAELITKSDITRKADAFETDMEYNIQPTDDNKTIYSEFQNFDDKINTYSEIVVSYMLKSNWERMKRQEIQDSSSQENASEPYYDENAMNSAY